MDMHTCCGHSFGPTSLSVNKRSSVKFWWCALREMERKRLLLPGWLWRSVCLGGWLYMLITTCRCKHDKPLMILLVFFFGCSNKSAFLCMGALCVCVFVPALHVCISKTVQLWAYFLSIFSTSHLRSLCMHGHCWQVWSHVQGDLNYSNYAHVTLEFFFVAINMRTYNIVKVWSVQYTQMCTITEIVHSSSSGRQVQCL